MWEPEIWSLSPVLKMPVQLFERRQLDSLKGVVLGQFAIGARRNAVQFRQMTLGLSRSRSITFPLWQLLICLS